MSKREKKEEEAPKGIELPFATIDRVYEPVGLSGRGRKDELDQVLDEEDKRLVREAKRLEVETIVEERKRKLARVKGESPEEGGVSPLDMLFGFLANQGMSGEDAANFIKNLDQETIAKLGMLSGSPQGQNALLPLVMFSRQQPQITPMDMVKVTSTYVDDAIKLADKMSPKHSDQPTSEFMQLFSKSLDKVDKMTDAMYQNQIAEMNRKLDNMTKPEDYLDKMVKTAEAFGFTRDHSGTQNLKVAEIEAHTTLEIEKLRQQHEMAILAAGGEAQKWQALQQTFAPVLAVAAGPIMEQMRGLGKKAGAELRGATPAQTQPQGGGPSISVPCKQCGQVLGPFQTPFPPMEQPVKCTNCGLESTFRDVITPPPQAGQPAEAPSEQPQRKAQLRPHFVGDQR